LTYGWVEPFNVADLKHHIRRGGSVQQQLRLRRIKGERFLNQTMYASLHQSAADLGMRGRGDSHDSGIDLW